MITIAQYDIVLASRTLCGSAIRGGMPLYKYVSNRLLTLFQNILMRTKASEFHIGYRAFPSVVPGRLLLDKNCDDFVFDNEMLGRAQYFGFHIGEVSCPTRYEPEISSISSQHSVKCGFGVLRTSMVHYLARWGCCGRGFSVRS